jgi:dTDP-4-dehydrorhamnose reductase
MSDRCVWVTGAGGLIGGCLLRAAPRYAARKTVVSLTRADLDLSDFAAVRNHFRRQNPSAVIHCAALSKSPDCQANPALARTLNIDVTLLLAELAAALPFVFFSSDLVFDGRTGNYDEAAPVNPLSVYAESKVKAEQFVLSNPRHTVIRTSLNSGATPDGSAFNELLRRAWLEGRATKLFVDEFRCPMAAEVTARATWELFRHNATGLYHVAGSEKLSRWQIGQLLAARWPQLNPKMEAGSLKDYVGAPRAPDTSLNCQKAQQLLSFPLPAFSQWLTEHPDSLEE